MNCLYCKNPCTIIPNEKPKFKMEVRIIEYDCTKCPLEVSYRFAEDSPQNIGIGIYFYHKGTKYCYYEYRNPNLKKRRASFYQIPSDVADPTLEVPSQNNINPHNVKEKFLLYMTFS